MASFVGKSDFDITGANQRAALDKFYGHPNVNGNVLYCYSGDAGGTGFIASSAIPTLIAAQTAATADNDDLVLVLPGHAEAVIGAAGMTFSKAGVTYRGVGVGAARPTISFTTAIGAQIIVSGARITFQNMIFDFTGFDAITAAISVTGADVTFDNCLFICQSSTISPVIGILTAATATRFTVTNCRFLGVQTTSSAATCVGFIKHEVGANFLFANNFMVGKATQLILNATTILEGLIVNNFIHVYTGTKGIALAAGTTGFGSNNRLVVASGTAPVVGAGFSWAGNSYTTEALAVGAPTALTF